MTTNDTVSTPGNYTDFERFNPFKDNQDELLHVSWTSLQQIYPNLSLYGGPTVIFPVQLFYVIGTAKGSVIIFTKTQFVQSVLSPSIKDFRSKVTSIDINQDGTHICAGYESGDIFIWDLNSDADNESNSNQKEAVLHIASHKGHMFNGISFIPGKHTNIVASDSTGHIVIHKGNRNHLWQLVPSSKEIMRLNPMTNPLLMTRIRNNGENYEAEHLMAVLSSRSFAIISLSAPMMYTSRLVELPSKNSSAFGYIAWNSFNMNQVAFSVDNLLSLIDLENLQFQWSYEAPEPICKIDWLTDRIMTILLVSNRLLFIDTNAPNNEEDNAVLTSIDLLVSDIIVPNSENHFAAIGSKIVVLTNYCLKVGKLNSWSDIVLYHIHQGNYINALGTLGFCLQKTTSDSIIGLLRLEKEYDKRMEQIEPSFNNLTLATVQYLLKQSNIDYEKVMETASLVFDLGMIFSKEKMYGLLEQVGEALMIKHNDEFQEVLYEKIVNGTVTYLSPILFKAVMEYTVSSGMERRLETILLSLDISTLDIDYAMRICKEFQLYPAIFYLWNTILDDYQRPLADIILFFAGKSEECVIIDENVKSAMLFDYLESTITGRIFPTEKRLVSAEELKVKNEYYNLLFSGSTTEFPVGSGSKLLTKATATEEPVFPYASLLLDKDAGGFLKVLDVSFEDAVFNESPDRTFQFTRQYLIDALLDILRDSVQDSVKVQISIFICKNLPKYSQFIRLTNTVIKSLIDIIYSNKIKELEEPSEQCLEALLSFYTPTDVNLLIEKFSQSSFYHVKLLLYKKAARYADYLSLFLSDTNNNMSQDSLLSCLKLCQRASESSPVIHHQLNEVICHNFEKIVTSFQDMDVLVSIIECFDSSLQSNILSVSDKKLVLQYLRCLFCKDYHLSGPFLKEARIKYLSLLYENNDEENITTWIETVDLKNVDIDSVVHIINNYNDSKTLVKLFIRLQRYKSAINEINSRINALLKDKNLEGINEFLDLGIVVSQSSDNATEEWVALLSNLVSQYPSLTDEQKSMCDRSLQKLFIKLSDRKDENTTNYNDNYFGAIIMQIFEDKSLILNKIQDIKTVLLNIFTAYSVEETTKLLILQIINQSASLDVSTYIRKRREGWAIKSYECEVCGKKIWGIGIENKIFDIWEKNRTLDGKKSEIGDSGILVYSCGHGFHETCLKNMGQHAESYHCLLCDDH